MCNCIDIQEKKVVEFLKERHPDKKFDESLSGFDGTGFKNKAIPFSGPSGMFLYQEFGINYTFTKRNGEESSIKKMNISIHHSYCCFCGEKLNTM